MEIHLKIIGILLIGLALAHVIFPKYFNWKDELRPLSLINKQMMLVHTFFVALTVLLMGILCLASITDLIVTTLGKKICFGFGLFWSIRLFIQFFGYSKALWKGKIFETVVHIIFSLLWTYLSVVFFVIWWE
jgi:hypothetical protein